MSPLCRIPDELLLLIMERLRGPDLASLRRTSRIFLRLFQDGRFRLVRTVDRGPWPRMRYLTYVDKRDLRQRLLEDKYCSSCYGMRMAVKKGPVGQALCRAPLYCAGCGGPHSAGLFSPWERAIGDPTRRICIAHEGHLRVCQHRVITWSDIQRWSSFLSPELPSYKALVCRAQSHLSQCGKTPGENAGSGGVTVKLVLVGSGQIKVTAEWEVHVSVPYRKGARNVYGAEEVRNMAESLHADAGQHIVPRFQADQPPHMTAFDPNFCGCLDYAGRGLLDWQMASKAGMRDCCRKNRSRGLFTPHGPFRRQLGFLCGRSEKHVAKYNAGSDKLHYFHIVFRRCCSGEEGTGVMVAHRHSFTLSCGPRRWPPDPREANFPPPEWFRVIDPVSYGLEGDAASRHILWCEDQRCANHLSRVVGVDRFRDMSSLKGSLRS